MFGTLTITVLVPILFGALSGRLLLRPILAVAPMGLARRQLYGPFDPASQR